MIRVFVAGLLLMAGAEAVACSCISQLDAGNRPTSSFDGEMDATAQAVTMAYDGAAVVAEARVESITPVAVGLDGYEGQEVRFTVDHAWKGIKSNVLFTRGPTQSASCGMAFAEGEEYLLYLFGPDGDGYYGTSICSRTKLLRDAGPDIEVLQEINAGGGFDGIAR